MKINQEYRVTHLAPISLEGCSTGFQESMNLFTFLIGEGPNLSIMKIIIVWEMSCMKFLYLGKDLLLHIWRMWMLYWEMCKIKVFNITQWNLSSPRNSEYKIFVSDQEIWAVQGTPHRRADGDRWESSQAYNYSYGLSLLIKEMEGLS